MKKMLLLFFVLVFLVGCSATVNDEAYYFEEMDLAETREYAEGESQTIAFIDTGISNEAKQLYEDRIVATYNSIEDSEDVTDNHGHGTQMVSVASGNGEEEVWGIAPETKIVVIKAFEEGEQTEPSNIAKAVDYAISKKAYVINMSFGSFVSNADIEEKINTAMNKDITVVASTGDYGNADILFPASMPGVVSVAAKNEDGSIWDLSNVSENDVAAFPGVGVNSLALENETIKMNGTSHATAMASGYVALLRDYYKKNGVHVDNGKIIADLSSLESAENKNVDYEELFLN